MKPGHSRRRLALVLVCMSLFSTMTLGPGCRLLRRSESNSTSLHIKSGGLDRTYTVHAPQSAPGPNGYPLVLAYHGHGGDGAGQERLSGMDSTADTNGFVVAYPDGVDHAWNDGRTGQQNSRVDDVGFTRDLIDKLEKDYSIDPTRVYATGMSNGGMMCYRLALDLSDRIAAIAPVAALMSEDLASRGGSPAPVAVMVTEGTEDRLMPYGGGSVGLFLKMRGQVLSAAATVEFWVRADGCSAVPETVELPDRDSSDGTRARLDRYTGGRNGTDVLLYTITGGGHTWPRGWQYLGPRLVGVTCKDYSASQAIWDFFNRHSLPR
ncbi:MAG: extracellular catalytic domain type 1 short-chain-length polyhydroxyalkanoate depolymerase [Candidatus Geothermincolia bacterium]